MWRDTWVPKLIRAPKWYNSTGDLDVDDLVYFKRVASELGHSEDGWVLGQVDKVERGDDSKIRRVWIRYKNYGESKFQRTERSIRSVVKLFSLEDASVHEDLAEVRRLMKDMNMEEVDGSGVGGQATLAIDGSCCSGHNYGMDLRAYLVKDTVTETMEEQGWKFMDEAYYGDVMEDLSLGSLLDAVLKIGF